MGKFMTKLFAKPIFDSKIKSANTEGKEKVCRYLSDPVLYGCLGTQRCSTYHDADFF